MSYGEFRTTDQRPEVEFERTLASPIDRVWAMLTTEEGLRVWLTPARVDLSSGGSIDLDFGEDEMAGGEITDLVPGETIEYRWRFPGEPDSMVRFDLEPVDRSTTRLRLRHWMLPSDQAVGYGAGWHAHLDQLEAALDGSGEIDWMERFRELMPEYQTRVS
jgi:uncharacterized protein YndB with AHSA1/START domain